LCAASPRGARTARAARRAPPRPRPTPRPRPRSRLSTMPLLDLTRYTAIEHAFFGLGCLCWVVAYIILCVRIRKLKFVEMPVFAACGNMAWEAVWSLVLTTDMGRFFEW